MILFTNSSSSCGEAVYSVENFILRPNCCFERVVGEGTTYIYFVGIVLWKTSMDTLCMSMFDEIDTLENLKTLSVDELKEICEQYGFEDNDTREELIKKILNEWGVESDYYDLV